MDNIPWRRNFHTSRQTAIEMLVSYLFDSDQTLATYISKLDLQLFLSNVSNSYIEKYGSDYFNCNFKVDR